jgi:deoxycytidylate deaminase
MELLRFIPVVNAISLLSKDVRTRVGCLVIDDDGNLISSGWNSFPRGVVDDPER